ncbi:MAG: serine--tRNA ligase [Candidatus Elarobacter sp.]
MLDLRFIRDNPGAVRDAIAKKGVDLDLEELLAIDRETNAVLVEIETLRAGKNRLSKEIPKAPAPERGALVAESRRIGTAIDALVPQLKEKRERLDALLLRVPGIPSAEAPVGPGPEENIVVRTVGTVPAIADPLDHVDLMTRQNWADFERPAKIGGSRSYLLRGDMVMVEFALFAHVLEKLVARGFVPMEVLSLVREAALVGTGHFPSGRDDVYHLPKDDLYLAGTAEVVLNGLHGGEILSEADLPIRYAGHSPCFRREAGSFGKDIRGLLRVHQFRKIEQYVICRNDDRESARFHAELLAIAEEVLQDLELAYQVVECSTGDMGLGKFRMNDIETWIPSLRKYRETHSCSTLHDWQARRANLRYRNADGEVVYAHTLNNTAIASPRILVALVENHQLPDGRVRLPPVLATRVGRDVIGTPVRPDGAGASGTV